MTETAIAEHALSFTEGERIYLHGTMLPLLTGSCSCGGWSRESHRFDAVSNPACRAELAADHKVHATRLTTDVARWPDNANKLHPLLAGADWSGDRTEASEYRKLRVPLEAGGLAKGTTYHQLIDAIRDELMAAVEAGGAAGVPLYAAPRLAAAKALIQQLERNFPKVRAWRVMVRAKHDAPEKTWCFLACHTLEEAEAFVPTVLKHLDKDRAVDSPWRYIAEISLGPVEIYKIQLPGMTPEIRRFG